jgi:hypothetical protein
MPARARETSNFVKTNKIPKLCPAFGRFGLIVFADSAGGPPGVSPSEMLSELQEESLASSMEQFCCLADREAAWAALLGPGFFFPLPITESEVIWVNYGQV